MPIRRFPSSPECWAGALCSAPLFAGGAPLFPMDIDHFVLGVGPLAPLPPPGRPSFSQPRGGLQGDGKELQALSSWAAFGLWLPVRFGLPPLRIFQPHMILTQLRLSAEALVASCLGGASLENGQAGKPVLRLAPLLRAVGIALWRPLLAARGDFASISVQACEVDWTFDVARVAIHGPDESLALSTRRQTSDVT
ncbi:unnamed protein product [Polarella glacialis]|uniref:Uncharacterized protein n=1 Tax=Polarella glacialis TaxID=89957 RepID=A0A813I4T8_POLGL|nr:unnamed protein product [Polarella glacialis]